MGKSTLFLDILLFLVTAAFAWYEQWSAKDLVWSLWISSLVLGYSYILTSIFGGLLRGDPVLIYGSQEKKEMHSNFPLELSVIIMNIFWIFVSYVLSWWGKAGLLLGLAAIISSFLAIGSILRKAKGWKFLPSSDNLIVRIIMLLPVAIFLLGFFTIHFLGFHWAHGVMLNSIFPFIPFGKNSKVFEELVIPAFHNYWPLILISALSRLESYKTAFRKSGVNAMFYPYLNVIRMHVMIFVIGFMGMIGLSSYVLYLFLFFYFFPIGSFIKDWPKEHS